ncbi:MAG TPA: RNA polymerase sigma factor, partial [Tepidisphaeraceae bacterium]|nr:RNA polymerase sigma factor [Tepidisphaeraceae bacterium]
MTRDAHDAEDATQAAFLTLAAKGRLNGEIHAPEAWLRKVGHRLALDLIRSKKRRNNRENQRSKMTSEVRPIDSSQSADNSETRSILHEELAKLPAGYRMPLILHYFGGLSREEMSDQLRIKPSTLGVRLHRAREQLKKRMARRGINMPMAALTLFLGETVRQRITDSIVAQTTSSIASIGTSHGLGFATVGSSIGSMQSSIISSNLIASSIRDVLASVATSKLKVGVVAFVAALSFGMNSPSIARLIPESIVQQIKRIKLSDFFNDFNPNLKPAQLKSPAPVLTSQTEQITPTLREFNNTFARADNSFQPYIPATSFNPVPIVTDLKPITIASIGARSVDDIAPTFTTSVPTARRIDTAPRTITNTPITTNSSFTSISSGPKAFRASSNSNVNRATTSNDIVRSNSSNSSSSDKSFRIGETTSNGRRASDGKNVSGAIISTPDFSDSSDTTSNGTRASSTGSKPNSGASIPPKPPKVTIDPPKQTTQNNSVAIPQSVDSILSTPSYLSSSSSSSSSSSNSNSNSNDYWTTNSSTNAPTGSSTPTAEINQFTISSVAVTDELHATHVARPGAFDLLLGDVESASFTETVRFSGTPDAFGGYNFATMREDQLSEAASVL